MGSLILDACGLLCRCVAVSLPRPQSKRFQEYDQDRRVLEYNEAMSMKRVEQVSKGGAGQSGLTSSHVDVEYQSQVGSGAGGLCHTSPFADPRITTTTTTIATKRRCVADPDRDDVNANVNGSDPSRPAGASR